MKTVKTIFTYAIMVVLLPIAIPMHIIGFLTELIKSAFWSGQNHYNDFNDRVDEL